MLRLMVNRAFIAFYTILQNIWHLCWPLVRIHIEMGNLRPRTPCVIWDNIWDDIWDNIWDDIWDNIWDDIWDNLETIYEWFFRRLLGQFLLHYLGVFWTLFKAEFSNHVYSDHLPEKYALSAKILISSLKKCFQAGLRRVQQLLDDFSQNWSLWFLKRATPLPLLFVCRPSLAPH